MFELTGLVVDLDPAVLDQVVGAAPGGDSGTGEIGVQAHGVIYSRGWRTTSRSCAWTTQGFAGLPKWRERIEEGERVIADAGGSLVGVYVTLGRYDVVEVFEAPDDDIAIEILMKLNRTAPSTPRRLRAFTRDGGRGDRPQAVSGYAFGPSRSSARGYGFRKVRRALGVTAFGVNGIVLPPGFTKGSIIGTTRRTSCTSCIAAVRASRSAARNMSSVRAGCCMSRRRTPRRVSNASDEDELVLLVVGGKDGYVERDGRLVDPERDLHEGRALAASAGPRSKISSTRVTS